MPLPPAVAHDCSAPGGDRTRVEGLGSLSPATRLPALSEADAIEAHEASRLHMLHTLPLLVRDHLQIDDPHRSAARTMDRFPEAVFRLNDAKREEQRIATGWANVVD